MTRAKDPDSEEKYSMKKCIIKPLQIKFFFGVYIKENISATIYTLEVKK